jgi:hypothetical protein
VVRRVDESWGKRGCDKWRARWRERYPGCLRSNDA